MSTLQSRGIRFTILVAMMTSLFASAQPAEANNNRSGYLYSVTIGWQQVDPRTNQVVQSGTYARYFVTVYNDGGVDYGGADKGWYDIMRYANCRPYLAHYEFVRVVNQ